MTLPLGKEQVRCAARQVTPVADVTDIDLLLLCLCVGRKTFYDPNTTKLQQQRIEALKEQMRHAPTASASNAAASASAVAAAGSSSSSAAAVS